MLKYAGAITAAPGRKFKNIVKKLQDIDSDYTLDIKEKLELIKLKVQYALKNLKGKKRIIFITTTVALLVFFSGNGTTTFVYFMAGLRELLGGKDDQDSIKNCIIEIYR